MKINNQLNSNNLLKILFYFITGAFALACLYPLLLAIVVSITDEKTIISDGYRLFPRKYSLAAYQSIFGSVGKNIFNAYKITIGVTIVGTIFSLFISSAFAFVLTMREFHMKSILNLFIYIPMIFNAGLLPWYIICTKYFHLTDKIYALVIPAAVNAFNIFLLRNFLKSIPWEIREASIIDGASYFKVFFSIYLPLGKVGLVTVGLFYALNYWNDYYLALMFIRKQQMYPLQYYLYNMLSNVQFLSSQANQALGYNISVPLESIKMATICITIGPILFFYPFAQKYFTKGVIVGAVKG